MRGHDNHDGQDGLWVAEFGVEDGGDCLCATRTGGARAGGGGATAGGGRGTRRARRGGRWAACARTNASAWTTFPTSTSHVRHAVTDAEALSGEYPRMAGGPLTCASFGADVEGGESLQSSVHWGLFQWLISPGPKVCRCVWGEVAQAQA